MLTVGLNRVDQSIWIMWFMVIVVVVYLIYGHTKTNIFCGLVIFKRMTFHEHSLIKIGLSYMALFEKLLKCSDIYKNSSN